MRNHSIVMYITLFLTLTISATAAVQDDLTVEIAEVISSVANDHNIPGVAVAIIEPESVAYVLHGDDEEDGLAITPDTPFNAASISKSITAWGVMALVEEGLIDLDAPVNNYLVRWQVPESEQFTADEVTVRRVLSHTAGLSVPGYIGRLATEEMPDIVTVLDGSGWFSGGVRILHEPGAQMEYSGGGYTVLQLLIEDVTGEDFASYIDVNIFEPLGMSNSTFAPDTDYFARTAIPHDSNGDPVPYRLFVEQAAAGFYTTASDLARFVIANAGSQETSVLSEESINVLHDVIPATNGNYALGFVSYSTSDGSTLLGHDGFNHGWRSLYLVQPDTGKGLVVLTNGHEGQHIYGVVSCTWANESLNTTSPFC